MRGTSNKNAWIWVAVAAITLTALSRTDVELLNAKAGANSVLAFLIKSQSQATAHPTASHYPERVANRGSRSVSEFSSVGTLSSMLSVFFVGLIAPLVVASFAFVGPAGRVPSSPLLCASFDRPPPQFGFAVSA